MASAVHRSSNTDYKRNGATIPKRNGPKTKRRHDTTGSQRRSRRRTRVDSVAVTRLGAQPDLLCEAAALCRIVGRDHGIVGSEPPALAVFFRSLVVRRIKLPLQHLTLLSVFGADD